MDRGYLKERDVSHWAVLAGLRFFLAATVFLGHYALFVKPDRIGIFGDAYLNPGSAVFGFFVISGYSIAASLDREEANFVLRRVVRIWPLYLFCVGLGVAMSPLMPFTWPDGGKIAPTPTSLSILASAFMLQSFISYPIPIIGPIWSLSIEWWHYMAAPWFKKLPSFALAACLAASFAAYIFIKPPPHEGADQLRYGLPALVLSWMWITGFLYYRYRGKPLGFAILALPSVFAATLGHFTGAPLFVAIFVLVLAAEWAVPKPVVRALNFLGDVSYPMYLLHFPVMMGVLLLGFHRLNVMIAAVSAVSVLALYLVDYPARRFFQRHSVQLPVPA
jgi:peptidoglycan/LPS O-acetylase OafA/YrhL